ncbi:ORF413 [White spot syndrome virus]|uniref:ORF413 n=1 Tax=White spot syndrome virus TaxID=342409 RepID=A0A2D3I6A1_9VIRU|nr:ORF413 [White spot syndrome virus]
MQVLPSLTLSFVLLPSLSPPARMEMLQQRKLFWGLFSTRLWRSTRDSRCLEEEKWSPGVLKLVPSSAIQCPLFSR